MAELSKARQEEIMAMRHKQHLAWERDQRENREYRKEDMKLRKALAVMVAIELIIVVGWFVAWITIST